MIFHETRLLADHSHETSYLIFSKIGKDVTKLVVCCSCDWRFKGYKIKWIVLVQCKQDETFNLNCIHLLSLKYMFSPLDAFNISLAFLFLFLVAISKQTICIFFDHCLWPDIADSPAAFYRQFLHNPLKPI